MPVTVDVGDRSAELGQISGSHAVLTLVHLDAQSEPDPVGDVEPVKSRHRVHYSKGEPTLYKSCQSYINFA